MLTNTIVGKGSTPLTTAPRRHMGKRLGLKVSGRYREVAVIGRWPLSGGGRYREVAVIGRWPLSGGGRYSEVAALRGSTVFG